MLCLPCEVLLVYKNGYYQPEAGFKESSEASTLSRKAWYFLNSYSFLLRQPQGDAISQWLCTGFRGTIASSLPLTCVRLTTLSQQFAQPARAAFSHLPASPGHTRPPFISKLITQPNNWEKKILWACWHTCKINFTVQFISACSQISVSLNWEHSLGSCIHIFLCHIDKKNLKTLSTL